MRDKPLTWEHITSTVTPRTTTDGEEMSLATRAGVTARDPAANTVGAGQKEES